MLTLLPNSVVHSIIYDEKLKKATGVRVIDALTKKEKIFNAKVIFLNASALNSNLILLNSKSRRFPTGLGNDSGVLGKYICWHNYRGRVDGEFNGFLDCKPSGKKSNPSYIPRFRNLLQQETDFIRGYAACFHAARPFNKSNEGVGAELKKNLLNSDLQNWKVRSWMIGEVVPQPSSYVYLDEKLTDQYGMPLLKICCDWSMNDNEMVKDYIEQMSEMFEAAGFKNIKGYDTKTIPGSDIHEMGGARMGNKPETSILNSRNQIHSCKNVFVTDGSCMVSTSTQNPSLTYMALTARAAGYAIKLFKAGQF